MTRAPGRNAATASAPAGNAASPAPPPEAAADDGAVTTANAVASAAPRAENGPDDEPEVTTAEFELELADGQTWAMNFYECAAEGDLECLEEILDSRKVGVNDTDVDGFTALMVAAAEGHRAVVRALLKRGADVGGRTHELRSTALHFAAKNGDPEIVEALCAHDGAVVDCWNVNADTPLIWACIEGRADAVRVLLAHGADVNVLNQYGASTLLCAVMIGEDPEQDAASDARRAEILRLLLEKKGSLVNFQDREGSTAMHLAASCGYLECVKTLLSFGADITLRNAIGQTPLEEAQTSDLRESRACVEHLRGIWRQLEEEAAARMMAMLEMEEAGGKSTGKSAPGSGKKSKKKNKKAKRKAAKQQQVQKQEQEQEQEQEQKPASASVKMPEVAVAAEDSQTPKDDDVESTGSASSSDDEEDVRARASMSSKHSNEENEAAVSVKSEALSAGHGETATEDSTPAAAGAWTTVGKKHRSALAAISKPPVNVSAASSASSVKEVSPMRPAPRQPLRQSPPLTSTSSSKLVTRRKQQRPESVATSSAQERNGENVRSLLLSTSSLQPRASPIAAATGANLPPTKPQEEHWDETGGFLRTSRSLLSSSLLDPSAASFPSPASLTASTTATASIPTSLPGSSSSPLDARSLPFLTTSPWRPSFSSALSTAPYTSPSIASTTSHYSAASRLTWKQQRASGGHQLVREARERWVSKLRLSNESVAETLSYLACGLCGELVNDNLQCTGGSSAAGENGTTHTGTCTQLYCASCLQSAAFHTAESSAFRCVKCHEVVDKARMASNSLAQAQAAALGLSTSAATTSNTNGSTASTQDETTRCSLEEMQHTLEMAEPRAAAVDLLACHLTPGAELTALSNGQLEVLERAHQLALEQIVERRLANARALERLQMEEWLKMQRDVLLFAPR